MLYYPVADRRSHVEIWQKKITRKCGSQAGRWSITPITNPLKTLTPADVDTRPDSVRLAVLLNVAPASPLVTGLDAVQDGCEGN